MEDPTNFHRAALRNEATILGMADCLNLSDHRRMAEIRAELAA